MPFTFHAKGYQKKATPADPFRYLERRGQKWHVRVLIGGERVDLGYHDLREAMRVRDEFERTHGRVVRLVRREYERAGRKAGRAAKGPGAG